MESLPVYKTEGIIIKSADLGQLDRLLTIYTRSYGKILVRAISARKKESKLRGYLEPFTYAKFLLAKSKTIDIVTDVEPTDNFSYLHQNLESLAYAFYSSELIDKLVVAPEQDKNLWALILRAFQVLNQKQTDQPKQKFYPLSLSKGKISASNPSTSLRPAQGLTPDLPKIRVLFEQKLLEFLGHGIPKNKKALEVIQGLTGEPIISEKFLKTL